MQESLVKEKLIIKSAAHDHVALGGYASVFNCLDSHNDLIAKGAFAKSVTSGDIKFLWQHDKTQPIGIVNSINEDDYGLYAEVTINSHTQQGKEAIALVKQGAINGLSIGFNIIEASYNSKGQREITLLDLWEISLVTFPSNHRAQLSQIKQFDDNLTGLSSAIDKTLYNIFQLNQLQE